MRNALITLAMLLIVTVSVTAQEEFGSKVEIIGYTNIHLTKSINNSLYILVITYCPDNKKIIFIFCRATGLIKLKMRNKLKEADLHSRPIMIIKICGHMQWGNYANYPQVYSRQPKQGIVIVIKHVEFDYEKTTINAGR